MQGLLRSYGLDPRVVSVLLALLGIWVALQVMTGGIFLTPRNLYNLSIQTCPTAIMACGMVFIIAARQIDLSVGSLLAFTGVLTAFAQARWFGIDTESGWIFSIAIGIAAGAAVGLFQGWWAAYRGIPAFVVTLAGFLMYRGAAFLVADGQTIAPLNATYQRIGGGVGGSLGATVSWIVGALACVWVVWRTFNTRREQAKYGAAQAPKWFDFAKIFLGCAAIVVAVAVMNQYADRTQLDSDGVPIGKGIGIPVLLLIMVVSTLSFIARRTRFGRYVFAYGGNPEAALLSGINTRRVLLGIFIMMGMLSALAGIITTARLNAGTNAMGQMAELYVISAAVIGGTSLTGGIGSIAGAVLGALIIQSLDNGMVLLDVSSAQRQIIIGLVLIVAVWFDVTYNKRQAK